MDDLVSICIPAYNNADEICATIESVLAQTYVHIELVIVDDASKDDTVKVVSGFQDNRIHLHQNKTNLGMSGNWNRCVSLCKGEFIKLLCADDILFPDCIEKEVEAMTSKEQPIMTISDSVMINTKKKKLGVFGRYPKKGIISGEKLAHKSLIWNNFFGMPCAVMFRKNVFEKVGGFDSQFKYILDYDLWLSMAPFGKVMVLPYKLNYFMLRNDSNTGKLLTKGNPVYYEEHVSLLRKHAKELHVGTVGILISKLSRRIRSQVYGIWLKHVLAN